MYFKRFRRSVRVVSLSISDEAESMINDLLFRGDYLCRNPHGLEVQFWTGDENRIDNETGGVINVVDKKSKYINYET